MAKSIEFRSTLADGTARRQRLEERQHLAAPKLLPNDDLLGRVDAVNLEHVLGDIQTDRCTLHWDRNLQSVEDPSDLSFRAATYSGVFTLLPMLTSEGRAHHGEILRQATRLAESGKLIPRLDPARFTLNSIGDAYAAVKNQSAAGKVVIEVD